MESKKLFKDLEEKQNKVLLQKRTVTLKEAREKVEWLKDSSANQIIVHLKNHLAKLKERFPIGKIALFGSILRNDFKEKSDVDILVEFESADFSLFLQLANELELILGRKVDLVTFRSLNVRQKEFLKDTMLYV